MTFPLPDPMRRALALAAAAAAEGEVPVGAVILRNGEILAEAANAPRRLNDPTAHAEMLAIRLLPPQSGRIGCRSASCG